MLNCHPIASVDWIHPEDDAVDQAALLQPSADDPSETLLERYYRTADPALLPLRADGRPCLFRLRRLDDRQRVEVEDTEGLHHRARLACRYGLQSIGGSGYLIDGLPLQVTHSPGPLGDLVTEESMNALQPVVFALGLAAFSLSRLSGPFAKRSSIRCGA